MVTFHDPHPGLRGCTIPFPEHLKVTAEWLVGQEMTIEEAVKCFKDAAPEGERPITVTVVNSCILVKMGSMDDFPVHCWRAIRFSEGDRDGTNRTE